MNGHPRDQASVRSLQVAADQRKFNVEMCRGIDHVAVQGRWPLTTGVAQGRYYCIVLCSRQYYLFIQFVLKLSFPLLCLLFSMF